MIIKRCKQYTYEPSIPSKHSTIGLSLIHDQDDEKLNFDIKLNGRQGKMIWKQLMRNTFEHHGKNRFFLTFHLHDHFMEDGEMFRTINI